jgi:molybdopterin molybdotransferase
MISFELAREKVLSSLRMLPAVNLSIKEVQAGMVLREDVKAKEDVPHFRRSAVDGYAVIAEDTRGASSENPVRLLIKGSLFPGRFLKKKIEKNSAYLISTGAPVPDGLDAVVMVEDTEREGDYVKIYKEVKNGENVAPRGEDIKRGEVVLKKGRILSPPDVGMLARVGKKTVKVSKIPVVSIISTGNEIVEPWEKKGKWQIYDANYFVLSSAVKAMGCIPVFAGRAGDRRSDLRRCFKKALGGDLIIFTGGVSMGEPDLVKDVLIENGVKEIFWKVAIQPGKPVFFGLLGKRKPVFGLPGNPVSAFITFLMFVKPALYKMMGADFNEFELIAHLDSEVKGKKDRTVFLRGNFYHKDGKPFVHPLPLQGSGILKSLTESNCIIVLREGLSSYSEGSEVKVIPFRFS